MYNRRYDKVFLMLRQETAGYAVGKRPPWGSCIMELKNGTGAGAAPASLCGVSSGREGEHFLRGAAPRKKGGACRAEMGI